MKSFKSKALVIWVLLIFLALLINMLIEDRNQKLLNHSKTVFGTMKFENHSSLKFSYGLFIYYVAKKKYELRYTGDFSNFNPGDTVLIKYAIEDPSVAKVINDKRSFH
jgi:hypothetical protein